MSGVFFCSLLFTFFVVLYLETHLCVSSFFFFFFFCCSLPRDTFRCLECFFFLVVLYLETHLRLSSVYFFFSFVVLDLETHKCVSSVSFLFFFVLYFETHYVSRVFLFSFYIVLDLETHLRVSSAFLLLAPLSNLILTLETTLGVLRQTGAVEPNSVSLIFSFPLTCHSEAGLQSSPVASTIEDTEEESDDDGMSHLPSFLFPFLP